MHQAFIASCCQALCQEHHAFPHDTCDSSGGDPTSDDNCDKDDEDDEDINSSHLLRKANAFVKQVRVSLTY